MNFEPFLVALQARLVEQVTSVEGRVYRSQNQGTATLPALWLWIDSAEGQGGAWTAAASVHAWVRTGDLRSGESPDTRLNALVSEVTDALTQQTGEKPDDIDATTLGGVVRYCRCQGTVIFDQGEAGGTGVVVIPVEALVTS
jgi:hypothetical protein